jgi:anti-sigma factor RsiW
VTQHEHRGHLTTEQLSAFLDKQLTPQEQAFFDAHLQACSQCQQALAELRRTVALLRAMPRVDVPRSFTLPTGIRPIPIESGRVNTEPPRRQRVGYYMLQRSVRAVSTLAAVLGFLFIVSGLLANVHFGVAGGGASSASPAYNRINSTAVGTTKTNSGSSSPNAVETRSASQQAGTPTKTPVAAQATPTPTSASNTSPAPPADQTPMVPPALDPSQPQGRLSLGLLLLLFSIIGLLTTRRRRNLRY